jgi:lysophospholipase L1-like esterase
MASLSVPRVSQSSAMLLPDGRVVIAGSDGQASAQFFSPPYLFKGTRPVLTSVTSNVTFGQTFSISTPDAATIAQITLLRLPAVSHSFDQNQRFIRLAFTSQPGSLTVTAPASGAVSPPGHYMLFLVNGNGVPSLARIINVAGAPGPPARIMPLGDSLTYGAGHLSHQFGGYRIDLLQKLTDAGVAVDFLGTQQSGPGSMSDRDHEGHNGWDILEMSESVNGWLSTYTPETILLLMGTNDINEFATGSTTAARLDSLIGQIYTQLPNVSIIVGSIPPIGDAARNAEVAAYNTLIPGIVAEYAADGKSIHFADVGRAVALTDLREDALHPNSVGYSKMATVWFNRLMAVLPAR